MRLAIDPREFVALVGFLEHRIVRHYDVKQREGLLQVGEMFDAAFGTVRLRLARSAFPCMPQLGDTAQYLKELGCPVPAGRREEQLMWLLNYAVAMRFEDDGEQPHRACCLCCTDMPRQRPASMLAPRRPALTFLVRQ